MEFLLILIGLAIIYVVLKFIHKVLNALVNPPFDNEAYRKNLVETIEEYRDENSYTRVDALKKANEELKAKKETKKAKKKSKKKAKKAAAAEAAQ